MPEDLALTVEDDNTDLRIVVVDPDEEVGFITDTPFRRYEQEFDNLFSVLVAQRD